MSEVPKIVSNRTFKNKLVPQTHDISPALSGAFGDLMAPMC